MPSWPNYMPQPVYEDIVIGAPVGAVIRTDMEAGPAKQRKRFTATPRPVRLSFEPITAVNLSQFESFFEIDLGAGALEFDMAHPITDAVRRFRFIAPDDAWSVKPVGKDAYRLDVNLELMP